MSSLTAAAEVALVRLLERLARDPFAPPEAGELRGAGLSRAHHAVRRGDLVRLDDTVYVTSARLARAVEVFAALPQPLR